MLFAGQAFGQVVVVTDGVKVRNYPVAGAANPPENGVFYRNQGAFDKPPTSAGDVTISIEGNINNTNATPENGIAVKTEVNDGNSSVTVSPKIVIQGTSDGIQSKAVGGGSVKIDIGGGSSVTGTKGSAISARTEEGGDVSISIKAGQADDQSEITGGADGVEASTTSGAIAIDVDATIVGGKNGIEARINSKTATKSISITSNGAVSGDANGISAINGGLGNVAVTATGDVTSAGNAIRTKANSGLTIVNVGDGADVKGDQYGVLAESTGGDLTIHNDGAVTGGQAGILATSDTGSITIDGVGSVTSDTANAIRAVVASGDGKVSITTGGSLTGAKNAISAINLGSGDVIAAINGVATSATSSAVVVSAAGGGDFDVTVGAAGRITATQGDGVGIEANANAGNGKILIKVGGEVSGLIGLKTGANNGIVTVINRGTLEGTDGTALAATGGTVNFTNAATGFLSADLIGNVTSDTTTVKFSIVNDGSWQYSGTGLLKGANDTISNTYFFTASDNSSIAGVENFGNSGVMNVSNFQLGTQQFANAGIITVADDGSLVLGAASVKNLLPGKIDAGAASLTGEVDEFVNSGALLVRDYHVASTRFSNNGQIFVSNGGTFEVSGSSFKNFANLDASAASVTGRVDEFSNAGSLTTDSFKVATNNFSNSGSIDISQDGNFEVTGSQLHNLAKGQINAGTANITASVDNAGTVNVHNDHVGDTLTINGNLVAKKGSTLELDADLSAKPSADKVIITGHASGNTDLVINVDGEVIDTSKGKSTITAGEKLKSPLLLVDSATGDLTVGEFKDGDEIAESLLATYILNNKDGDISLSTKAETSDDLPTPGVTIPYTVTTIEAVFFRPISALVSGCTGNESNNVGYGAWGRANGGGFHSEGDGQTSFKGDEDKVNIKNTTDYVGFQGGLDTVFCDIGKNHASIHLGVTGGYIDGSTDQRDGGFGVDFNSYFVGGYAAFISGAFSADAAVRYSDYSMDLSHTDKTIIAPGEDTDAQSVAVSGSMAYRFNLSDTVTLTSQAGMTYLSTSIDSFHVDGGTYSFDDETGLIGYAGLNLQKQFDAGNNAFILPYVQATVFDDFGSTNHSKFKAGGDVARIDTERMDAYGQFTAGLKAVSVGDSQGDPTLIGALRFDAQVGSQIEGWAVSAEGRIQF